MKILDMFEDYGEKNALSGVPEGRSCGRYFTFGSTALRAAAKKAQFAAAKEKTSSRRKKPAPVPGYFRWENGRKW